MNWAFITDTHFGCRNDSKIFYKIFKNFYLNTFIPYLEQHKIKTLFLLGDCFDKRKYINFESLKLAQEIFFNPIKDLGIEVFAIVGNHDASYKNTNAINSMELVVKPHYSNVHVFAEPTEIVVDDVKLLMLPWINQENYERSIDLIKSSDARIVFSHLELKGFEYQKGLISDIGHCDVDLLARYDFVFSGHYHHKSNQGSVYYLGCPYQLTWADYSDEKGFHVFDGKQLTFVKNPEEIFIKFVYNDSNQKFIEKHLHDLDVFQNKFIKVVVQKKNNPILFERLISKIVEIAFDVKIIDESNYLKSNTDVTVLQAHDPFEVIKNFVEQELDTNLSKEYLLQKLHDLYIASRLMAEDV